MNNLNHIENQIDNSIISSELTNLTSGITEVGIDGLLENGILKDLPIVSSIISATKIGIAIKERIFLKKVLSFLYQVKDIPINERQKFIEKITGDDKYKTKVGESLLLILDKLNDYTKAELIGKLFAASIKGEIDYNTFLKLSNIIDRCYVPDLHNLVLIYKGSQSQVDDVETDILYNLGVLINKGVNGQTFMYRDDEKIPNKRNQLEINKYGKLIVKILFTKDF
ncbi:hypothetical protein QWZ08_14340 [Ferruginibacter paludis]|uniref:hypothetical protein n=1 Tax=Ferruginibacter paludis TaxID=1310417 RepID=UPI0025B3C2F6|nr:hypothetical protein [Ferruginibacter paludis]MDN3656822.1 hypothetical protein [Ferruginibacter paludis]